jgi:hypothetical protein
MKPGAAVTTNVPPLSILARANPATVNEDDRSVELVFSTGAPVERYDWWEDQKYLEQLEISKSAIRVDRLNTAPLLDAHSAWSITDQIGTVVAGSFRIDGGDAIVRVRFSKRAAVEEIWRDVKDRVIQNVSVGYRVHKFEQDDTGAIPVRTAVDWEPYEVSMVPMPADVGARVRAHEIATNSCLIIRKEPAVKDAARTPAEHVVEQAVDAALRIHPAEPARPAAAAGAAELTDIDRAVAAETKRVEGIITAARAARMPQTFIDEHISKRTPLEEVSRLVFVELQARNAQDRGPQPGAVVVAGEDPLVHVRGGIEEALCHRIAPQLFKLSEKGRPYRGLTLLDTARTFLHAAGIRTSGLSKMELAAAALGLNQRSGHGYHTTSDFAFLLADVANKTLRRAYEEAPQTFRTIARQVNLPDFKPVYRTQMGDAPALLEVKEHGEFKRGTIGEGRETYQLTTYGRVFAITRKALVNDDADAFGRVPTMFGRAARNLESDLVWDQITSNPEMGDGNLLFSAEHLNYDASGDVISVDSLGAARAAMRQQVSLDGERLNIVPRYLIVGSALETKADQITTAITPNTFGTVNPFSGKLTTIAEPRLDNEPLAWYLGADPAQIDIIEFGYLEGEEGPTIETRIGFDVDGVEIKCREDFASKVLDWRGLYKNAGDENT